MRKRSPVPSSRLLLCMAVSALLLTGCATNQSLMPSATEGDLEEFVRVTESGANPYRVDESGEIPFRELLTNYDDDNRPDWVQQRLVESAVEAKSLLTQIKLGMLSVDEFERLMTEETPFYPDALMVQGSTNNTMAHALVDVMDSRYIHAFAASGADLDQKNSDGWTPLMQAVYDGRADVAEALIAVGADVDVRNDRDWTALHFTGNDVTDGIRHDDEALARLLIEAGARLDARTETGLTPSFVATLMNRPEVLQVLINAGANVDIPRTSDGSTALMVSVYKGYEAVTRSLVAASTDLDMKNENGWTALHFTSNSPDNGNRRHDETFARLLIEAGADVNAQLDGGQSAAFLATVNNRPGVLGVLLDSGADPNMAREDGWTPLIAAVYYGHLEGFNALIAAGADPDAKQDSGWTALHYTASNPEYGTRDHDVVMARRLIESGANINFSNAELDTPLSTAASRGRLEVANVLLEMGADTDVINRHGKTPEEVARDSGNAMVADAIMASGH